jgi:hypothetical protein
MTTATATLVRIIETLPESVQDQVVDHLRLYEEMQVVLLSFWTAYAALDATVIRL